MAASRRRYALGAARSRARAWCTATLQTLKPGDRVTLMCGEAVPPATGTAGTAGPAIAAPGELADCDVVVAIVLEKTPPAGG